MGKKFIIFIVILNLGFNIFSIKQKSIIDESKKSLLKEAKEIASQIDKLYYIGFKLVDGEIRLYLDGTRSNLVRKIVRANGSFSIQHHDLSIQYQELCVKHLNNSDKQEILSDLKKAFTPIIKKIRTKLKKKLQKTLHEIQKRIENE